MIQNISRIEHNYADGTLTTDVWTVEVGTATERRFTLTRKCFPGALTVVKAEQEKAAQEGVERINAGDAERSGLQQADDEQIGIVEFTEEDTLAIATIDLQALKPVVTPAQFAAIAKFVHVNQTITGLNEGILSQ